MVLTPPSTWSIIFILHFNTRIFQPFLETTAPFELVATRYQTKPSDVTNGWLFWGPKKEGNGWNCLRKGILKKNKGVKNVVSRFWIFLLPWCVSVLIVGELKLLRALVALLYFWKKKNVIAGKNLAIPKSHLWNQTRFLFAAPKSLIWSGLPKCFEG